jgi:hypothetical protein
MRRRVVARYLWIQDICRDLTQGSKLLLCEYELIHAR